ncbi:MULTISPECIES: DNA-binding transcriptional response regulator [Trueperella]|uniref:DNA-binding NtrC family response regulator n=1 Tax=Trueperella abortisuis TaxID=445930 RepID=A0ABT9PJZ3_9ACTO|nr:MULTISPECIES: two-component system response regulator [Trueperella]MCI7304679.1 two-component system response regulator [Trueperella sp.]MDP9832280.1 DNA-binding NtrC family response regulator [Trueperella abortisuis]MDY5403738.1 two-component system response regulator [Trueperella sp.]
MTQDDGKTSVEVLVYSDNRDTRNDVMHAVGRRVGKGLPAINWTEAATWQGAYMKVEENHFDLLILDGEAAKLGGIGLGKLVRDELVEDMPYIVLIGRPQDEWLARVSKPNAILPLPVDARALSQAVADVLGKTGA